jgi:Arc/MetJ-type ribon-helix-helix transcriptional regulator
MKTITVRLPEPVAADIKAESEVRGISKSDVIRERLTREGRPRTRLETVADLIGSLDHLPADLSAGKKRYLQVTAYGRKPR